MVGDAAKFLKLLEGDDVSNASLVHPNFTKHPKLPSFRHVGGASITTAYEPFGLSLHIGKEVCYYVAQVSKYR